MYIIFIFMEFISLASVNMEYGNRNSKLIKERSEVIMHKDPDLILIQESNLECINFENKYKLVEYHDRKIKEKMDIFLKRESNWELNSIFDFVSELGYVKRICKIIEVRSKKTGKKIRIANIHLIGGRFEENDKIGKMLIGNIKTIRERKNEVVDRLVKEYNIDIIGGDFNSDLNCYLNNGMILEQHLNFMKKISPKKDLEIYQEWNVAPYNYLKRNNYILSIGDVIENTSLFENHPDSIWFKDKFYQKKYEYIDLLSNNLSDHNGIFVELKLK